MAFDLSALSSAWHGCDGTEQSVNFGPVGEPTLLTLTVADKKALAPFVNKHYVDSPFPPVLSPRAAHYMRFRAWGDHYGSWHSRYAKTSNVLVQWSIFAQDRVYPGRIKRFIQVETSIPLCSAATVELAKRSTCNVTQQELTRIGCARDRMAQHRKRTVHTLAVIQWYKNVKLVSGTGPVAATLVVLTRPDLSEDVWWKDRFQDDGHVAAIISGFIQYPVWCLRSSESTI